MLVEQAQDRRAGADLDVVGVGADGEQVRAAREVRGSGAASRHSGSAGCQTAHGGRPVSKAVWSAWTSLSVSIGAQ